MSKKINLLSSVTLLALAVGAYLILSGAQTLIDFNSPLAKGMRSFGKLLGADQSADVITVVVAILKIVSGAVLAIGPFGLLTDAVRKLAFWIVGGFWAVFIVWMLFQDINQFQAKKATLMQLFQSLSLNVAILAAVWQLKPDGK